MQFHPHLKKGKKAVFSEKNAAFSIASKYCILIHMRFLRLMRQVTRLLFFFRNLAVIVDT